MSSPWANLYRYLKEVLPFASSSLHSLLSSIMTYLLPPSKVSLCLTKLLSAVSTDFALKLLKSKLEIMSEFQGGARMSEKHMGLIKYFRALALDLPTFMWPLWHHIAQFGHLLTQFHLYCTRNSFIVSILSTIYLILCLDHKIIAIGSMTSSCPESRVISEVLRLSVCMSRCDVQR